MDNLHGKKYPARHEYLNESEKSSLFPAHVMNLEKRSYMIINQYIFAFHHFLFLMIVRSSPYLLLLVRYFPNFFI